MTLDVVKHPNTWVEERKLGQNHHGYSKTFQFGRAFIDDDFKKLVDDSASGMLQRPIPGNLRRADALKIYELAFFSSGSILELGTFKGLSTSIIARAISNAGKQRSFTTVDLDPVLSNVAKKNVAGAKLSKFVEFVVSEGTEFVKKAIARKASYGFLFIDHSHAYKHVLEICKRLNRITSTGAFVLFHDFNDPRNQRDNLEQYGVFQAVSDGLNPKEFEFYGTYGCCGLYRRRAK